MQKAPVDATKTIASSSYKRNSACDRARSSSPSFPDLPMQSRSAPPRFSLPAPINACTHAALLHCLPTFRPLAPAAPQVDDLGEEVARLEGVVAERNAEIQRLVAVGAGTSRAVGVLGNV